jgi:hypothetical protein
MKGYLEREARDLLEEKQRYKKGIVRFKRKAAGSLLARRSGGAGVIAPSPELRVISAHNKFSTICALPLLGLTRSRRGPARRRQRRLGLQGSERPVDVLAVVFVAH